MIIPTKFQKLINALRKLPEIGPKMAERLAYYILNTDSNEIKELIHAIESVKSKITFCKQCHALSEKNVCDICNDETRDHEMVCVVENMQGLLSIEKTKKYKGVYHVLGGSLSPLDGRGPDSLRIKELAVRIVNGSKEIKELIIATDPDTDGEMTANYIAEMFKSKNIKITRIGYGLPVGGSLEYADEITLTRSLDSRKEMSQ